MAFRAPFPPLIPGGDHLQEAPASPNALRRRMAELWGVTPEQVVVTRGALHAYDLLFRLLVQRGFGAAQILEHQILLTSEAKRMAEINGLSLSLDARDVGAFVWPAPSADGYHKLGPLTAEEARSLTAEASPALIVVDETLIDFTDIASLTVETAQIDNLVVIRDLSMSHGLAGAPCGAMIASPATAQALAALVEPVAIPTPVVRAAEAVLAPDRALATASRIAEIVAERDRLVAALAEVADVTVDPAGPFLVLGPDDEASLRSRLVKFGVEAEWLGVDAAWLAEAPRDARVLVRPRGLNEGLLAAFGLPAELKPHRRAEQVRDTKETRITVRVDLDAPGAVRVQTGFGFYDHMLEQIAVHGGFSLQLGCAGDLHIDAHHVIEDCALALGAALDKALGDRRGIGRFGFVLPMDEAEARISIDLGGRPYCDFSGEFAAARLGDYPTQMTGHFFKSMAESLRAAIHLEVRGDNDHHKVEACFKAFGRALRQALKVEGAEMPSSKGVL